MLSTDIRQIPDTFETSLAPFISLGNGKSRVARANSGAKLAVGRTRISLFCAKAYLPIARRT
jgi:hypothetical protein